MRHRRRHCLEVQKQRPHAFAATSSSCGVSERTAPAVGDPAGWEANNEASAAVVGEQKRFVALCRRIMAERSTAGVSRPVALTLEEEEARSAKHSGDRAQF